MTGLEYVLDKLYQDFGEYAGRIYPLLDLHMAELTEEDPTEEFAEFEKLLNDAVHPFLSCRQAMVAAGVDYKFADRYVRKLIVELPEEIAHDYTMRELELR